MHTYVVVYKDNKMGITGISTYKITTSDNLVRLVNHLNIPAENIISVSIVS